MASPHIAGSMALLREKYPTWPVADLKALLLNTANNDVVAGANTYGPQRVGTGRVDLVDAFNNDVIAYNTLNKAGVSVSFGAPEVVAGETLSMTRTVTIENKSAVAVTYAASIKQGTDALGVAYSVSPASVNVPANGTATVTITLNGDPNAPNAFANSDPTMDPAGRHRITEESGWLVLTPGADVPLRVSLYSAPQLVSAMSGALTGVEGATGTGTITLTGTEVATGATVGNNVDIFSVVSPFELAASSPNEPGPEPDMSDLAYVGVSDDYSVSSPGTGYVYFGLAAHGEWATPSDVEFVIYVDLNRDGTEDYLLYNTYSAANANDFLIGVIDLHNTLGYGAGASRSYTRINTWTGSQLNTYLFNNNVMVYTAPMGLLHEAYTDLFGDPGTRFNYWVETYARRYSDAATSEAFLIDSIGSAQNPLKYDPVNPVYDFTGGVGDLTMYLDLDGETIEFPYNFSNMKVENIPDILLLHHHNSSAAGKAQVVSVDVVAPGGFELVSPSNGQIVTDPASMTQVTWTEAADAASYTFYLFRISNNARQIGEVLVLTGTAASDSDAISCAAGSCALSVDASVQSLLTDGTYSWTVVADGFTEASNAPYTFKVNTGDIELLVNGGFESASVDAKTPDGWDIKNASGEKRKVNKPEKPKSYSGDAFFLFKGKPGENSKIVQNVLDNTTVTLGAGDTLTASVYLNTKLNNPGKVLVKVKYDDPTAGQKGNGKDKLNIPITATTDYQQFTDSVDLAGSVKKVKFIIKFNQQSGKMFVDDASLIRNGLDVSAGFSDTRTLPLP